jgi:hypothetical protein
VENLRVHLANCYVGSSRSPEAEREAFAFTVDRFRFRYLQQPYQDVAGARKSTQHTSDLLVEDVSPAKLKDARRAAERVGWMLAFISGSKVVPFGHEYPDGSGNRSGLPVSEPGQVFRPALPAADKQGVVRYLEGCYPSYKRLERSRKLNVVVDYLLLSDAPGQPIEVRLLLGAVLLENLKATYVKRLVNGKKLPFREALTMMFEAVGMRPGLKQVVKWRNEVVHTGLPNRSYTSQMRMYERIHDLLREYLLRLLGYQGQFQRYSRTRNRLATLR